MLDTGFFSIILKTDYNNGKAYLPKPYGNENSFHCCGSKLPDYYTIPTSPFERVFSGQSFSLSKTAILRNFTTQKTDVFPPNRITDLKVKSYLNSSLNVILEWTAPGDDYNIGTAFDYEMKCYTSPGLLMDNFLNSALIEVHKSQLPRPKEAGSKQSVAVTLPWTNEVFYYAITSIDESNNRAAISNLVAVFVEELKTTTQFEMSFKVINSSMDPSDLIRSKYEAVLDNDTMIYVISGGITAFLLVLIALFTVAMCRAKRKRALKERPSPPPPGATSSGHEPSSLHGNNSRPAFEFPAF